MDGDYAGGAGPGSLWRGGSCSNVHTYSASSHLDTSGDAGANSYPDPCRAAVAHSHTPYADPDPGRSRHRGAISYHRATFADTGPYPYQDATASHSHRRPSYPSPNPDSYTSSDTNRRAHPDADPKSQSNARPLCIDNYRLRRRWANPGAVYLHWSGHFATAVLE